MLGSARRDDARAGVELVSTNQLPAAQALQVADLVSTIEGGIASRILAKTAGGNVTLFAFDGGQGLTDHTSPFDALAIVLQGTLAISVGETQLQAIAGTLVRLPANVSHALEATEPARMLLVMLRESGG